MDARAEVRDFLTSRRARITPQQAGLPDYGGNRRVPGLRRSELATLAGISVEYLTQLERGNVAGASDSVLDALARALQLDEAERTHLFDLARAANGPRRTSGRGRTTHVRPSIQRILDMLGSPAYARTGRGDIVAVNTLCTALYGDVLRPEALPVNVARFVFLDPRSREFFLDWDTVADDTAASLRIHAGQMPNDRQLSDLVGELATRSDAFSARWGRHDVRLHRTATKRLHRATRRLAPGHAATSTVSGGARPVTKSHGRGWFQPNSAAVCTAAECAMGRLTCRVPGRCRGSR